MNPVRALTLSFEGQPLTTVTWNGQPAWVAREIGRRLGYVQRGKRLVTRITHEWSSEFIAGTDFVILAGADLAEIKAVLGPSARGVPPRASSLMLLLEPGLHLVLTKTDKPLGQRLRRFLADDVLPQIVRRGSYQPDETSLVHLASISPNLTERREARLLYQATVRDRWVDFCDRRLQVKTLHRTIDRLLRLGLLDTRTLASLELLATEIALGTELDELRPVLAPSREERAA